MNHIKHIKQIGPTCGPCAISMLSGMPLRAVQKKMEALGYSDSRGAILTEKIAPFLHHLFDNPLFDIYTMPFWRVDDFPQRLCRKRRRFPACLLRLWQLVKNTRHVSDLPRLTGTGLLHCAKVGTAHLVAFSDSVIYDSAFDEALTLSDWLSRVSWSQFRVLMEDNHQRTEEKNETNS